MSGTVPLTIGGSFNGLNGVVSIPSSLLFGSSSPGGAASAFSLLAAATTGGSVNSLIQNYLTSLDAGSTNGSINYSSIDLATGESVSAAGSPSATITLQEISDVSNTGGSAIPPGAITVSAGVTDLIVAATGNVTLTGDAADTSALFGASSNVNYSVVNPAAGVLYLAGGADSVTLQSLSPTLNAETIYSAGADRIALIGQGTDYVSLFGGGSVSVEAANAFVHAEGSATTNLYWDNANAGGTLNFINSSSVAATIHIGVFFETVGGVAQTVTSATHVTAQGGAGGGYYVGGSAGGNSLVGGSGVVTLVGAGPGDFLEAQSSVGTNVFFSGSGDETLEASTATGANIFSAGLNYPGLGQPPATGVISSGGSGNQQYFLGNVPGGETIYGSTSADTAMANNYFVVSDATAGGGLFSIYNFVDARSTILLSNGNGGAGSASITGMGEDTLTGAYTIELSDSTTILLKGLDKSQIAAIHTINAFGITGISG